MGSRKNRKAQDELGSIHAPVLCLDEDAIINLDSARLLDRLRSWVQSGSVKLPNGVYKRLERRTTKIARTLRQWQKKYSIVHDLDSDLQALTLLPDIEKRYGEDFRVGGITYRGFWKSPSGQKSVDAQVVALAKARGWTVVSNDNSIHGACMLEEITCMRWERIGGLLRGRRPPSQLCMF